MARVLVALALVGSVGTGLWLGRLPDDHTQAFAAPAQVQVVWLD